MATVQSHLRVPLDRCHTDPRGSPRPPFCEGIILVLAQNVVRCFVMLASYSELTFFLLGMRELLLINPEGRCASLRYQPWQLKICWGLSLFMIPALPHFCQSTSCEPRRSFFVFPAGMPCHMPCQYEMHLEYLVHVFGKIRC